MLTRSRHCRTLFLILLVPLFILTAVALSAQNSRPDQSAPHPLRAPRSKPSASRRPPSRRLALRRRLERGRSAHLVQDGLPDDRRRTVRAHRAPGRLRRLGPLHRRHVLRPRARPHRGQFHGPRRRRRRGRERRGPRPGSPRSVPGQAERLHLLRQPSRRPERGPGLRRALQPELGRHLGRQEPDRPRRLVLRDAHPLQDHLLQAGPRRLGHERRALYRPETGNRPPLLDESEQLLQQPE